MGRIPDHLLRLAQRVAEGRWVTIGAKADPKRPGKKKGGTPVELDGEGVIQKGPAALTGKRPSELSQSHLFTGQPHKSQRKLFAEPGDPVPPPRLDPEAKPQAQAPAKKEPKPRAKKPQNMSLLAVIRREGGISGGDFEHADFREHGLLGALNKNGFGIDDMAAMLVRGGHIIVPHGVSSPGDHLLQLLKKKTNSLLADKTSELEKDFEAYARAREEALAHGHESGDLEEVRGRGQEAGADAGTGDILEEIFGPDLGRGGEAGAEEPGDLAGDAAEPASGVDTSFDFGPAAAPKVEDKPKAVKPRKPKQKKDWEDQQEEKHQKALADVKAADAEKAAVAAKARELLGKVTDPGQRAELQKLIDRAEGKQTEPEAPPAVEPEPVKKQPHEMTRAEYEPIFQADLKARNEKILQKLQSHLTDSGERIVAQTYRGVSPAAYKPDDLKLSKDGTSLLIRRNLKNEPWVRVTGDQLNGMLAQAKANPADFPDLASHQEHVRKADEKGLIDWDDPKNEHLVDEYSTGFGLAKAQAASEKRRAQQVQKAKSEAEAAGRQKAEKAYAENPANSELLAKKIPDDDEQEQAVNYLELLNKPGEFGPDDFAQFHKKFNTTAMTPQEYREQIAFAKNYQQLAKNKPKPAPPPAPGTNLFGQPETTKPQPATTQGLFGEQVPVEDKKAQPQPTAADDAAKGLDWLDQKQDKKTDGTGEMFGGLFSPGQQASQWQQEPVAPPRTQAPDLSEQGKTNFRRNVDRTRGATPAEKAASLGKRASAGVGSSDAELNGMLNLLRDEYPDIYKEIQKNPGLYGPNNHALVAAHTGGPGPEQFDFDAEQAKADKALKPGSALDRIGMPPKLDANGNVIQTKPVAPEKIEKGFRKFGPPQKPPHEMTRAEFAAQGPTDRARQYLADSGMHRGKVQAALDAGQNVPAEVLADYPGIKKTEPQQGPTAKEITGKIQAETDARRAQAKQDAAKARVRDVEDYQQARQAAIDAGQDVNDGDEKQMRRMIRQNEKDRARALQTIANNGPDAEAQAYADRLGKENERLQAKLAKSAGPVAPPAVEPSDPVSSKGQMGGAKRRNLVELNPIQGPSGAKLTGYNWEHDKVEVYDPDKDDIVTKRISAWDRSEKAGMTNRDIVHMFNVEDAKGKQHTVSLETAAKMLGFDGGSDQFKARFTSVTSAAKTLARLRMEKAAAEQQGQGTGSIDQRIQKAENRLKELNRIASGGSPTAKGSAKEVMAYLKQNNPTAYERVQRFGRTTRGRMEAFAALPQKLQDETWDSLPYGELAAQARKSDIQVVLNNYLKKNGHILADTNMVNNKGYHLLSTIDDARLRAASYQDAQAALSNYRRINYSSMQRYSPGQPWTSEDDPQIWTDGKGFAPMFPKYSPDSPEGMALQDAGYEYLGQGEAALKAKPKAGPTTPPPPAEPPKPPVPATPAPDGGNNFRMSDKQKAYRDSLTRDAVRRADRMANPNNTPRGAHQAFANMVLAINLPSPKDQKDISGQLDSLKAGSPLGYARANRQWAEPILKKMADKFGPNGERFSDWVNNEAKSVPPEVKLRGDLMEHLAKQFMSSPATESARIRALLREAI